MVQASLQTIALLPWGNVIEDFLKSINLSLEAFCNKMTGGWLFGYIEALKKVGVETVIICISAKVDSPTRQIHKPTGAIIWLLPVPQLYLPIHRLMVEPYGGTVESTFGKNVGILHPWYFFLREVSPYLATPLRSLSKVLEEEGCQAILCQEYEHARFDLCIVLGSLIKVPVYASFQGGDFQLTKIEKLWRRWSMHACDGVIVASKSEVNRLQKKYGLAEAKISQIFNPLDTNVWQGGDRRTTRSELGVPLEAKVVVWHGRVDLYRKGLDILTDVWKQISERDIKKSVYLLLIGTGSDAPALHRRIEQMELPRVHWINEYILNRERIRNYLKAADIYILPSRHEGFPVAPLEAMACGLPIVATEVPGIPDILDDYENSGGIRVPCEDSESLALALIRLLDDEDLRQQLGRQAKQRVKDKFSLLSVGHNLRNFIFPNQ